MSDVLLANAALIFLHRQCGSENSKIAGYSMQILPAHMPGNIQIAASAFWCALSVYVYVLLFVHVKL